MDQTPCPKGLATHDKADIMAANEAKPLRVNAMLMTLADDLGYIPAGEELYQEFLTRFTVDLKAVARSWGDNPDEKEKEQWKHCHSVKKVNSTVIALMS